MDDDLLNDFINESREHLATIEADLLTIEEGGADINEQLVNKVFRAAHSIKARAFSGWAKSRNGRTEPKPCWTCYAPAR